MENRRGMGERSTSKTPPLEGIQSFLEERAQYPRCRDILLGMGFPSAG